MSLAGPGSSDLECVVEALGLYPAGREALKGIELSEVMIRRGLSKHPPAVVWGGGVRHPCCALSPCWGRTQWGRSQTQPPPRHPQGGAWET